MRTATKELRNRLVAAALLAVALGGCSSARHPDPAEQVPSGWPVDSRVAAVSSSFGAQRGRSRHQGIDLSAPKGTPVWATADGKVVVAERDGAYGRTIVIDHGNGFSTRYAHLKRIKVRLGERVRRGDTLGTVGASGRASGSHLHYEVRRGGTPIDPRPFLGGGLKAARKAPARPPSTAALGRTPGTVQGVDER